MNRKIGISYAHNIISQGACSNGFCEHKESKKWSDILAEIIFKDTDIEIHVSHAMGLEYKVRDINAANCSLAVEIHFNACGGCGASGSETLYHPGSIKGKEAALIVQKHLPAAMLNSDRGAKEGWYKMDRPGVIDFYGDEEGDETPDYFLKRTNCTALIIEPEFIEHSDLIEQNRVNGVFAIATAIKEFMDSL